MKDLLIIYDMPTDSCQAKLDNGDMCGEECCMVDMFFKIGLCEKHAAVYEKANTTTCKVIFTPPQKARSHASE